MVGTRCCASWPTGRPALPARQDFRRPDRRRDKQTGNNNVNRRFTGRGLKIAEAAADDETKERKDSYG